MYCQSCGGENPDEARFCMTCGTGIAAPGDKGGLIVDGGDQSDDTDKGIKTLKGGPSPSPPDAESSKPDKKKGEKKEPEKAVAKAPIVSAETTLAGLRSQSTNTMANVSLSLASISLRTPTKAGLIMALLGLALVAAGAASMYGVMMVYSSNVAVIATTDAPHASDRPPLDLDKAPGGGADGQFVSSGPIVADLGSGKVSDSARPGKSGGKVTSPSGGGSSSKTPGGSSSSKTPSSGGGSSQSSSTVIEAPPDDETGESSGSETAPTGSSGGGTEEGSSGGTAGPGLEEGGGERNIEMDMYAGHVRRVIRQFYAVRAQSCFDRATRNNHNLRGTVVVRFTVGGDGNVSSARPATNSTGDDDLGQCLAGQVRSWRLPVPPNEQPVDLEMPFSW